MNKWIAIALLSVSMAGCKQGLGERCQTTDDCAEGVCAVRDRISVCVASGEGGDAGGMFDAEAPPDPTPALAPAPAPAPPIDTP